MAIPKIDKKYIDEALEYIDEHGVPHNNQSYRYYLVTEDGKEYPPMFVIAVARDLSNGVKLSKGDKILTDGYDAGEAVNFLQKLGFTIETREKKTEQSTSKDSAVSTDESVGNQVGNAPPTGTDSPEERVKQPVEYQNPYSKMLIQSHNIIFHGAPGTGKTYLAKEIAADIISDGTCVDYKELLPEQKRQVEFVQFHPSYDYTDFVEGLRPIENDGTIVFKLQDGIFKKFVDDARENYEDAHKSVEEYNKESSIEKSMDEFFSSIEIGVDIFKTVKDKEFTIQKIDFDDNRIIVSNQNNEKTEKIPLNIERLRKILESGKDFTMVNQVSEFLMSTYNLGRHRQEDSYYFVLFQKIKEIMNKNGVFSTTNVKPTEKKYVFIIDEINRGEISKIFGELFFAIDPGYRGKKGEVSTQYANMHEDKNEKFYIPKNVYIIGTMNDIDRSVDSFDYAMRRRFRFIELKTGDEKRLKMLDSLGDYKDEARKRMTALNEKIAKVKDLNENYQIGPAYFLKLKDLNFDFNLLWTDYLQPLLHDYIQGMHNDKVIMTQFKNAYDNKKPNEDSANEAAKD